MLEAQRLRGNRIIGAAGPAPGGRSLSTFRIIGSFACSLRNVAESLDKMAGGLTPVIDTEVPLAQFETALARLEGRQVFGKIIVTF